MADLLTVIERNILSRHLLKDGERVVVAVSGGLDSIVLLRVLHELSPSHGWKLSVAHLNHRLRGRASDADERLVRQVCASLKCPLSVQRRDVASLARRRRLSLEMAGREARHAFLARTALLRGSSTVALAHHADDQVELFFLRLLRGCGSQGLAGMRWRAPSPANRAVTLVRPLLDQSKSELREYAREMRVLYREDATNAAPNFLRNRIRNKLLPLLRRQYQPALNRTVLRVMDILGAEAEFVSRAASRWGSGKSEGRFVDLPDAVQRRWLQQQLAEASVEGDFELVESLRSHPGRPIALGPKKNVVAETDGSVKVATPGENLPQFQRGTLTVHLSPPDGSVVFEDTRISWTVQALLRFARPQPKPGIEVFDADRVGRTVVLRHWQPGDRFQPIGMSRAVKLQDLFTNEKVLRKRRHELILAVTDQNEVFWVEGLRISERFKLTKSTKRRLIWRFKRP